MPKVIVDLAEFYSADETAELLHKGRATIWRMVYDKRLVSIKVGNRVLIPKTEIERLKPKIKEPPG